MSCFFTIFATLKTSSSFSKLSKMGFMDSASASMLCFPGAWSWSSTATSSVSGLLRFHRFLPWFSMIPMVYDLKEQWNIYQLTNATTTESPLYGECHWVDSAREVQCFTDYARFFLEWWVYLFNQVYLSFLCFFPFSAVFILSQNSH